jgi:hypothetical protein
LGGALISRSIYWVLRRIQMFGCLYTSHTFLALKTAEPVKRPK